jgi:hypothetical protein
MRQRLRFRPNSSREALDIIEVFRPGTIVEVGSWYGASAIGFLQMAEKIGAKPQIICVDTWLGSIEHWLNWFPDSPWDFNSLNITKGQPDILSGFWDNVEASDLKDR